MPEEYRKVVLDTYKKKKLDGSLSPNLSAPTPGDLREECLIVYRERQLNSNDDEILRQFFGPKDQEKGYFTLIENSPAEKFKQMPKILKGKVTNPGIKFIELLAWLIDFQPRTSISYYNSFDKRSDVKTQGFINTPEVRINETQSDTTGGNNSNDQNSENDVIVIDEQVDNQGDLVKEEKEPMVETTEVAEEEETTKVDYIETEYVRIFSTSFIIITCIISLFIGSASFVLWENSPTMVRTPNPDEKFMYWDEDHYEPVKDEKQNVGAAIIPLNIKTLTQQRKINLPDTMTTYSLGKVWYKGHGKDHEFFTDSGAYPLDLQRMLKPLSSTILTKYTSNYRYLLTRLVWFLCAAIFVSLCGFAMSKLQKEVKSEDKLQEDDSEVKLSIEPMLNGTEVNTAV
ncbi:hypothetical protein [Pedobacter kyonggii]|uniref:Uncharacterized protein n=1 Tax=Pedobacter kyonggii TaxID=1926871 RepID=A0A4V2JH06_9SPHI|nr:hypothetical protein [Pedobacter kyonggii]TBO43133.1 hypothetical protein EYS08_07200 [Pedobacter kyonggii]